jgi:outer membrane biosynthesis protein TonB
MANEKLVKVWNASKRMVSAGGYVFRPQALIRVPASICDDQSFKNFLKEGTFLVGPKAEKAAQANDSYPVKPDVQPSTDPTPDPPSEPDVDPEPEIDPEPEVDPEPEPEPAKRKRGPKKKKKKKKKS